MSGNDCDIAIASGKVPPVQLTPAAAGRATRSSTGPAIAIAVAMTAGLSSTIAAGCAAEPSQAVQELQGTPLNAESAPLPDPLAPPLSALDALAKRYAAGLSADGPAMEGELAAGERRDHLLVLRSGACYRVLGAAEGSLEDLDLALFDPAGAPVAEDPGQDRYPVLGVQSGVCPAQAGSFRLQAHAYVGQGKYAVRVFRTGTSL